MSDILLTKANKIIHLVALKYLGKVDGLEYEDLMQIGRITVWQLIESKDIDESNFDSFAGYIYKSITYALGNEFKKSKAKKRIDLSQTLSLDGNINEDSNTTFYEIIASKAGDVTFETLEYVKIQALKTRDPKVVRGVIYCLIEILGIMPEQAPKIINYETFVANGLARFLWVFFNNSPYRALRCAYPDFSPEDMKKVPNNYWSGKRGKNRSVASLKKALVNSSYEANVYPLILTEKFIEDIGLRTPYQMHFKSCPFLFLDATYPNCYKPWEMARTPKKFLKQDDELVREIIYWLVEEKLCISLHDMDQKEVWRQRISKILTRKTMEAYGLRGLLAVYGNSAERLIRIAYPDKFMPWDFQSNYKWCGPEGLKLAARATKWVIEEYSSLHPSFANIGFRFFVENGLHGMITCKSLGFNSSPRLALKNAYPDLDFD